MTGAGLIDIVMNYTENVSSSDAGNATRRLRVLQWAQEAFTYIYNYRSWRFTYKAGTLTVSSDGTGVLPTDFGQFGWKGGLLNPSNELMEESVDALSVYARFKQGERDLTTYALLGFDTATGQPKIQTLQTSGTLTILYSQRTPTITDDGTAIPMPVDYHQTVLLPLVILKSKKSKGDVRDFQMEFLQGLDEMCRREASMQGTAQVLPLTRIGW